MDPNPMDPNPAEDPEHWEELDQRSLHPLLKHLKTSEHVLAGGGGVKAGLLRLKVDAQPKAS
jgi:hypothetical protein